MSSASSSFSLGILEYDLTLVRIQTRPTSPNHDPLLGPPDLDLTLRRPFHLHDPQTPLPSSRSALPNARRLDTPDDPAETEQVPRGLAQRGQGGGEGREEGGAAAYSGDAEEARARCGGRGRCGAVWALQADEGFGHDRRWREERFEVALLRRRRRRRLAPASAHLSASLRSLFVLYLPALFPLSLHESKSWTSPLSFLHPYTTHLFFVGSPLTLSLILASYTPSCATRKPSLALSS